MLRYALLVAMLTGSSHACSADDVDPMFKDQLRLKIPNFSRGTTLLSLSLGSGFGCVSMTRPSSNATQVAKKTSSPSLAESPSMTFTARSHRSPRARCKCSYPTRRASPCISKCEATRRASGGTWAKSKRSSEAQLRKQAATQHAITHRPTTGDSRLHSADGRMDAAQRAKSDGSQLNCYADWNFGRSIDRNGLGNVEPSH